jgi:MoaD family protein
MVKYFPPYREAAGARVEELALRDTHTTVKDLLMVLGERHPKLAEYLNVESEEAQRRHLMTAVDSRLARLSDVLKDGDEVKLLPPLAGG